MTADGAHHGGRWTRLALTVAGLTGWRRASAGVLLGALAVAALPPLHWLALLPVSFTGLVWLIKGSVTRRAAFAAGWWFGLGYFVAGLYWFSHALLVDAEKYAWLIPFAVGGLSAAFAIYPACAALMTHASGTRGIGRVLALAASWTAMEWLRGVLFTGFPWNPLGNVWTVSGEMIQLGAVTGVFGLSLVTVLAASAPAVLADRGSRLGRWGPSMAAIALLALIWGGGAWRLAGSENGEVPGVRLRIVQANIPQADKWRPALRDSHVATYLNLSGRGGGGASHVIWPETAVPFAVATDRDRRRLIASVIPKGGLLLTGSIRIQTKERRVERVWNSLHAVDGEARVVGTYDKFHLVPFGEYVPLRGILKFPKLTAGRRDFTAGPGPRTLNLPGLPPVSALICYEAIFPGSVTDAANRPGWLLNITNDAWFGTSIGPYQHFASARMRAVEEGLPLVRAANTGISAVVDSYGRVRARIGLGRKGVLDAPLPMALAVPPPFARFGNVTALIILLMVAIAARLLRTGS